MARDDLFAMLLSFLPRQGRILEVGCNLGYQLSSVGRAGFDRLYGIDIQLDCLETISRERPELSVVGGSGLALPFAKSVWSDGTYQIVLSPDELLEKLSALVPPPRLNLVRYHGVLAPNAVDRAQIVPGPKEEVKEEAPMR